MRYVRACLLCGSIARVGDRCLYHAGGGDYSWYVHLQCLSEYLREEPEFLNAEHVQTRFDEKRQELIARYASIAAP